MSIRNIIQLKRDKFLDPDTSLRRPSNVVEKFDGELQNEIRDLVGTFESHQIAVGLAAPQIGIQLNISVINVEKGKPHPHLILINPRIAEHGNEEEEKYESCMSLPLSRGKVKRYKQIGISFQDQHGVAKTLKAEGFLARVIQHEIDHLGGILYVDRMPDIEALEPSEIPKVLE